MRIVPILPGFSCELTAVALVPGERFPSDSSAFADRATTQSTIPPQQVFACECHEGEKIFRGDSETPLDSRLLEPALSHHIW